MDFSGNFSRPDGRFAIVAARFNSIIVERLAAGSLEALIRYGVRREEISLAWTPGALEIPLVAKRFALAGCSAVIALGAVVRGDTTHYDVVVHQSAAGIASVALETGVPVLNAILTVDNLEQAFDRAGGKAGNKGYDAAVAAVEMVNLLNSLPPPAKGGAS